MEYMRYDRGRLAEVRCKGACAVIIATGGADGAILPTPDYTELVLAMREPTGLVSKHETGVCRACKRRILRDGPGAQELEAIFAQDVEQWRLNALRAHTSIADVRQLVARESLRTPLRALDEAGRGEA